MVSCQYSTRTHTKEGVYRTANMLCKPPDSNWIMSSSLVSSLDLSLVILVSWPLWYTELSMHVLSHSSRLLPTEIRICVVVLPPSWAYVWASRRVSWHRPLTASSKESPKSPFSWIKKTGSCKSASSTCCLKSFLLCGIHSLWGTTVPVSLMT